MWLNSDAKASHHCDQKIMAHEPFSQSFLQTDFTDVKIQQDTNISLVRQGKTETVSLRHSNPHPRCGQGMYCAFKVLQLGLIRRGLH